MAAHRGGREAEVARVEAIVAEEVEAYLRAQAAREATAVIARLREKAEQLRQECLQCGASDEDYLTDLFMRKLLHDPLVALRRGGAEGRELAAAAAELFGLENPSESRISNLKSQKPVR